MMRVEVLGCGEAFDSVCGNTAFYLGGARLLIDCGFQIPERVWKRALDVDAVLFTHLHADHFFGIVPLLVRENEEGRKRRFTVMGPRGVERAVGKLLRLGYPGLRLEFPVRFMELSAGGRAVFSGYRIESAATRHSVLNLAYRISDQSGKSVGISGDGVPTRASVELLSRCDLIFQEAYTEHASPWKHADLVSLCESFSDFTGRVLLTHVSRRERGKVARRARETPFSLARAGAVYRV